MSKFQNTHLHEAEVFIKENYPESYSYEKTQEYTNKSNKVIIGQNNLVIALLTSLHQKLDILTGKNTEDSEDLSSLVTKLKDLKIGQPTSSKQKPKYLVWNPQKK